MDSVLFAQESAESFHTYGGIYGISDRRVARYFALSESARARVFDFTCKSIAMTGWNIEKAKNMLLIHEKNL